MMTGEKTTGYWNYLLVKTKNILAAPVGHFAYIDPII